jgi:hypothetical protein
MRGGQHFANKYNAEFCLPVTTVILHRIMTLFIVGNSKQLENITFRKMGLFSSSGEVRETPTLLGPIERANWLSD